MKMNLMRMYMPKSFVFSKIKTCQTEDNVDMSRYQSRSTSALRGNNSGIETSIPLTYLFFILLETYNSKIQKARGSSHYLL